MSAQLFGIPIAHLSCFLFLTSCSYQRINPYTARDGLVIQETQANLQAVLKDFICCRLKRRTSKYNPGPDYEELASCPGAEGCAIVKAQRRKGLHYVSCYQLTYEAANGDGNGESFPKTTQSGYYGDIADVNESICSTSYFRS